jgi:hypothetical protein
MEDNIRTGQVPFTASQARDISQNGHLASLQTILSGQDNEIGSNHPVPLNLDKWIQDNCPTPPLMEGEIEPVRTLLMQSSPLLQVTLELSNLK